MIHCLWNDIEISVLEEQANDCLLHVSSLVFRFHGEVVIDLFRSVAGVYEFFTKSFGIPLGLVSLENDIALGVDEVGQVHALNIMSPLMEEMFNSVLSDVHQGSLKESFLEILVLTSVL